MNEPYIPQTLPLKTFIDYKEYKNELITCKRYLSIFNRLLYNAQFNPYIFIDKNILSYIKNVNGYFTVQEKINQCTALKLGEYLLSKKQFSIDTLEKLHKNIINNNVRGSFTTTSAIRTTQNSIVYYIKKKKYIAYIPPKPEYVKKYLNNLMDYINFPNDNLDPLVRLAIINGQFELIHPFNDGNGRLGRTLIPLYMYYKSLIPLPIICMDEVLNKNRSYYHNQYKNIYTDLSVNKNHIFNKPVYKDIHWGLWIKFFLKSLSEQLQIMINKFNKINDYYLSLHDKVKSYKNSSYLNKIIEYMFNSPTFTLSNISISLSINKYKIKSLLNILVRNNILSANTSMNDTSYIFTGLISLVYK